MDFWDSTFDDFNGTKIGLCTNLQKKYCIGEQLVLVVIELLNNSHHIRLVDLGDLPEIWKKSPMFHWGGGGGGDQGWLAIHS